MRESFEMLLKKSIVLLFMPFQKGIKVMENHSRVDKPQKILGAGLHTGFFWFSPDYSHQKFSGFWLLLWLKEDYTYWHC